MAPPAWWWLLSCDVENRFPPFWCETSSRLLLAGMGMKTELEYGFVWHVCAARDIQCKIPHFLASIVGPSITLLPGVR